MEPLNRDKWLADLKSGDVDKRNAAARASGPMGAMAVAALADLMAGPDKGVSRAAAQAMQRVAHHSARPGAARVEARRTAVELLKVAFAPRPRAVRVEALEGVGFVGDGAIVPFLVRLLDDKEVREEARMALERIPGPQSQRALMEALQRAPEEFKPSLRQSIHNRGLSRATVGAVVMR